VEQLGSSSGS